jgi:hypothetical protein
MQRLFKNSSLLATTSASGYRFLLFSVSLGGFTYFVFFKANLRQRQN